MLADGLHGSRLSRTKQKKNISFQRRTKRFLKSTGAKHSYCSYISQSEETKLGHQNHENQNPTAKHSGGYVMHLRRMFLLSRCFASLEDTMHRFVYCGTYLGTTCCQQSIYQSIRNIIFDRKTISLNRPSQALIRQAFSSLLYEGKMA